MSVHIAEATVDPLGRLVLDHLPFRPGDKVEVIVRTHEARTSQVVDLRGSVLRYEHPFEPVTADDWDIQP
jgi:hypothetical protein